MQRTRRPAQATQTGFTLLELLVAITVTALIGVGIWQLLGLSLRSQEVLERQSDGLQELQRLMLFLDRDFQQVSSRMIRNEFGDRDYTLTNRNTLYKIELVRAGWRNPLNYKRSEMQRVAYAIDGETLLRLNWAVLDRAQDSEPRSMELMKGIETFSIQFLTPDNAWVDEWPPDSVLGTEDDTRYQIVPRALRIDVEHRAYGKFHRLYDLPVLVSLETTSGNDGGAGDGTGEGAGSASEGGSDDSGTMGAEEGQSDNFDT